jgi:predicted enzyme related to lactoylglutathione lyase
MSDRKPEPGRIAWIDLTVENAEAVRDFYREVAGWTPTEVPMGGYSDFCMTPRGETEAVAGVCHARGQNTGLPSAWLIYIVVEDLDRSLERCVALGGSVLRPPTEITAQGRFCVIKDPGGAVAALFQSAA